MDMERRLIHIPTVSRTEYLAHSSMKERREERCEERVEEDNMEDMIQDVGVEAFAQAHVYETMSVDAETPLYVGSTKFTRLSTILRLMNLKATNGWTDKSFTELLVLLNEMFPEGNTPPTRNYDAKKILCPMGMEYNMQSLGHACILLYSIPI